MQEFFTSLPLSQQLMLVGIVGAVVMIPIKDILSFEVYDICDVFFSTLFTGFLLEAMGKENGAEKLLIGGLFIGISVVIVILKLVLFVPFQRKAETSALMSRNDYLGESGKVTVSIRKYGLGEIVIYTPFGNVPMTAAIYQDGQAGNIERIASGEPIRVMNIENSIAYVEPYIATTFLPPLKSSWGKARKR